MSPVLIRPAQPSDCLQVSQMRAALWPESSAEEHARELMPFLEGTLTLMLPLENFVAEISNRLVGFLEVDLRSHADGCDPSRPVGYIEGWYVIPVCRRQGIGRRLLAAAEDWARSQNCKEMASDTQIENQISQTAHQAEGYQVVDRCVHFRKPL